MAVEYTKVILDPADMLEWTFTRGESLAERIATRAIASLPMELNLDNVVTTVALDDINFVDNAVHVFVRLESQDE